MKEFTVIAALLFLGGCSVQGEGHPAAPLFADTLFLSDTVGVLMGDTCYTFGTVAGVIPIPEGFAVLDGVFCRVSLFDQEGVFLRSAGRKGEGPGEFSSPFSFCRLPGGEYLIYDFGTGSYSLFDEDLRYQGGFSLGMGLPLGMSPGTDSTAVINRIEIGFVDEKLMVGCRVFSINGYSGEEIAVYMEHTEEMGGSDVDLGPYFSFFTTDSSGRVYQAQYDSQLYAIAIVSAGGDSLGVFLPESEPRVMYDPETHSLGWLPMTIPLTTQNGTSNLGVSALRLYPFVSALSTGPGDSIWVRRMALPQAEHWDVLSPEGELARRVVLFADTMGTGSYPRLHLSPWGMAATMTENEVERFYLVEQGHPFSAALDPL